ncbi:hypothetical protein C8F01DRAFT_1369999 [Mycena amicta]|nr:hypothetical protein C8F01DRAFT_1369999 [Mycena amicta]
MAVRRADTRFPPPVAVGYSSHAIFGHTAVGGNSGDNAFSPYSGAEHYAYGLGDGANQFSFDGLPVGRTQDLPRLQIPSSLSLATAFHPPSGNESSTPPPRSSTASASASGSRLSRLNHLPLLPPPSSAGPDLFPLGSALGKFHPPPSLSIASSRSGPLSAPPTLSTPSEVRYLQIYEESKSSGQGPMQTRASTSARAGQKRKAETQETDDEGRNSPDDDQDADGEPDIVRERFDAIRPAHTAPTVRREGTQPNANTTLLPNDVDPTRNPGTRQRRCKKKIEEDKKEEQEEDKGKTGLRISTDVRRAGPSSAASASATVSASVTASTSLRSPPRYLQSTPTTSFSLVEGIASASASQALEPHPKFPPVPSAAVQAAQQGWWDAFLRSYTLREIATDLDSLYTEPGPALTLSFVNPRFLLKTLWDSTRRLTLQPGFILASMAFAVLLRSHDGPGGAGAAGRDRAAFLRQSAQDALERAWRDSGWVDASLAEAALLIAQYEASAHPEYHPDRVVRALRFLDEVLTALGLTGLDAARADVCRFAHETPPLVIVPSLVVPSQSPSAAPTPASSPPPQSTCTCLPSDNPPSRLETPPPSALARALPWDPAWGYRQLRDEECRRVVWGALSLATSVRTECLAMGRKDVCAGLRMCEPANYLVLFPNELYADRATINSRKSSIWALYCRSLLLTNFCGNVVERERQRTDESNPASNNTPPAVEPFEFASTISSRVDHEAKETLSEALQEAWNEVQAIQDELEAHVCGLHAAVAYLCRENIANTRMIIARGLRSIQGFHTPHNRPGPLFNKRQAQEWIHYQSSVITDVSRSLSLSLSQSPAHAMHYIANANPGIGIADPRTSQLIHRPFALPWFYHQLAICLMLWESTSASTGGGMVEVLELGKLILVVVEKMAALWPCEYIQTQTAELRTRLAEAAATAAASLSPGPMQLPMASLQAQQPQIPMHHYPQLLLPVAISRRT